MAASGNGASRDRAADGNVPGPYDEIGQALVDVPRPRPVRLSRRGKTTATILTLALLASLAGYVATLVVARRSVGGEQSVQPQQFPLFTISMAFIVIFSIAMLNVIARQKKLLAGGEIATARVTQQRLARHGPAIRYEFTTPLGEHLSHSASDGTRQFVAGMSVPVFYDSQKPKRQLALCASFYEVVLPGGEQRIP